ncbi:MAG: hypothetical protein N2379_05615 [Verrucomicrobiae bacterium]|nr:hypothetical protein [Verrucomicrobiae bacterium]
MKTTHATAKDRLCAGITLIECLAYIGAVAFVLGVSTAAFYQCMDNSIGLRRNADDIVRALKAGERWREDVRAATAPPRLEQTDDGWTLTLRHETGEVAYQFVTNVLVRRADAAGSWTMELERVKSCHVLHEQRRHVVA